MTPLVKCTLAYIAGLIVPFYLAPEIAGAMRAGWLPAAGMLCIGFLLFALTRGHVTAVRGSVRGSMRVRAHVPAVLFAILGVVAGGAARTRNDADCRARLAQDAVVTFAGQPASLPGSDGGFALVLVAARGSALSARGSRATACSGIVRAKLPPGVDPSRIDGRGMAGRGVWMSFQSDSRLPTLPERRGMLLIQQLTAAPASMPLSRMLRARTHAQTVLRATLKQYGLAEALVLAQREGVDHAVNDAFTQTGMSHLLSISGTHVALVAALLIGFVSFLRMSGNAGRIGATIGVVAYVIFLGAPAAAARSAIQVVLLLSGRILQRPCDPYSVLAAAALSLLVTQPLNLLDAGFQLSFAGVIGLIAYRGRIAARLPRGMPLWLRDGIAASVAASGVTLPIAAMQFGSLAPIGIPASIIAVPLVGLALPAVALVLILGSVSIPLARFFARGADVLLACVWRVADVAARVPGGHAPVSADSMTFALCVAALVVLWWAWHREHKRDVSRASAVVARDLQVDAKRRMKWKLAATGACAIACVAWMPELLQLRDAGAIEIHAIDVGQGDAIAVRTPHGHWILIDAGPRDAKFDAGRARVVPYLLKHGAHHVDALILSHPHADHIGGADAVMAMLGAGEVIDPVTAVGASMYVQTMDVAARRSGSWLKARDGRHFEMDGVRVDFLYPASDSLDGTGDANDLSVACRVRYGAFSALFMGDAPTATEDRLVAEYGSTLASAVLKVGHHGSDTSTGETFLDAVSPAVALVSVGRGNRYGHPNPGVMARLVRHGTRVVRTDEHGSILVRGRMNGGFSVATQR